jgi:hypothetical protein
MLLKRNVLIRLFSPKWHRFSRIPQVQGEIPRFLGSGGHIGVQRPDFAEFTLSAMTKILLPQGGIRMTADGIRMTVPTSSSAAREAPPFRPLGRSPRSVGP